MTSLLRRISKVAGSFRVTSQPISSGAFEIAHSEKCVRYSSVVIPPLPTSSMSGSFQPPGPAKSAHLSFSSMMLVMLCQLSLMSPVVRQLLPTVRAHLAGSSTPHSHIEKKIVRPDLFSASRIASYRGCGGRLSE